MPRVEEMCSAADSHDCTDSYSSRTHGSVCWWARARIFVVVERIKGCSALRPGQLYLSSWVAKLSGDVCANSP